jgi:hypothetical protein
MHPPSRAEASGKYLPISTGGQRATLEQTIEAPQGGEGLRLAVPRAARVLHSATHGYQVGG